MFNALRASSTRSLLVPRTTCASQIRANSSLGASKTALLSELMSKVAGGASPQAGPGFRANTSAVPDMTSPLAGAVPPQAGVGGYPPPSTVPSAPSELPDHINYSRTRLRLHCHASPNNTIATLTKADGSTIAWFSGGSCGFKKGNRASYEAGYQCAVRTFKKVEEIHLADGPVVVDLFFKGFGQGREALKSALLAAEGEAIRSLIGHVTDRTPIKIGGTRAKKRRRL